LSADFYAIELVGTGRYLRRVANVSGDGLLLETPLADETPGQRLDLVLPRKWNCDWQSLLPEPDWSWPVRGRLVTRGNPDHPGVAWLQSSGPGHASSCSLLCHFPAFHL